MASRLKEVDSGDSVELVVSRVADKEEEKENDVHVDHDKRNVVRDDGEGSSTHKSAAHALDPERDVLEFDIPWNYSPSAGLGISLKAQRIYQDDMAVDSGLYVRSVSVAPEECVITLISLRCFMALQPTETVA